MTSQRNIFLLLCFLLLCLVAVDAGKSNSRRHGRDDHRRHGRRHDNGHGNDNNEDHDRKQNKGHGNDRRQGNRKGQNDGNYGFIHDRSMTWYGPNPHAMRNYGQPSASNDPYWSDEQSQGSYSQTSDAYGQSSSDPSAGYGQPSAAYVQPSAAYGQAPAAYGQMSGSYGQPDTSEQCSTDADCPESAWCRQGFCATFQSIGGRCGDAPTANSYNSQEERCSPGLECVVPPGSTQTGYCRLPCTEEVCNRNSPMPGPTVNCSDGSTGGAICSRNTAGVCAWTTRACPADPCFDDEDCPATQFCRAGECHTFRLENEVCTEFNPDTQEMCDPNLVCVLNPVPNTGGFCRVPCGSQTICSVGHVCCNPSCGICSGPNDECETEVPCQ